MARKENLFFLHKRVEILRQNKSDADDRRHDPKYDFLSRIPSINGTSEVDGHNETCDESIQENDGHPVHLFVLLKKRSRWLCIDIREQEKVNRGK